MVDRCLQRLIKEKQACLNHIEENALTKCGICSREELMPFTCRYCGQSFCADHRLPESHGCPHIWGTVIPMKRASDEGATRVYAPPSAIRTSRTELLHLAIAMGVFFIVEASSLLRFGVAMLMIVAGITAMAFLLHELAHKFTAQQYGLWSEFRIDPFGALISLLTAISPFKIIAPGAVVIFGSKVTLQGMGKIALAGPLANLIQVPLFIVLSQFHPLFWFAAVLNADLALFNLIPLSVLDGRKILRWNKTAWATAFAVAIIFFIMLRTIL